MMKNNGIKSLRNPFTIYGYRIFGDILPFIGFEEMEAPLRDLRTKFDVDESVKIVTGDFFTLEWLGFGLSFGGFNVPVKRTRN